MSLLTPARVRNGDLLTNNTINCTKRKVYDWIFFDDDDFWDSGKFAVGDSMFTQLDLFVNKTGNVHLQGKGLTMNTRTSWLTQGTATVEEDDYPNNHPYSVLDLSADHPLGQTFGAPVLEKTDKNFDSFEHDNNWRTNTVFLAGFSESSLDNDGIGITWDLDVNNGAYIDSIGGNIEDDYTFVATNTRGGVVSALANKEQKTTPEMRLALNSVLFSVVTPEFDHNLNHQVIRNGGSANLTLTGTVDSGMLVYNLMVYDELPAYVTPDNSSINLYVEGSYTYHSSNNTIVFNLGNPNQTSILNGTLFSYNITVTPPMDQPTDLVVLNSTAIYDDNWNTGISSFHCTTVGTINYMSFIVNKSISPGHAADNYTVSLNLTSLVNFNQTNVSIFDLVPANFSITNPAPNYNGSQANRYYWTMDLTAGESKLVTYSLVGTGRYNLSDAFTVGVDP